MHGKDVCYLRRVAYTLGTACCKYQIILFLELLLGLVGHLNDLSLDANCCILVGLNAVCCVRLSDLFPRASAQHHRQLAPVCAPCLHFLKHVAAPPVTAPQQRDRVIQSLDLSGVFALSYYEHSFDVHARYYEHSRVYMFTPGPVQCPHIYSSLYHHIWCPYIPGPVVHIYHRVPPLLQSFPVCAPCRWMLTFTPFVNLTLKK
eukprot:scaffold117049_cov19-Tisochrysis_lutea.AAC.1